MNNIDDNKTKKEENNIGHKTFPFLNQGTMVIRNGTVWTGVSVDLCEVFPSPPHLVFLSSLSLSFTF